MNRNPAVVMVSLLIDHSNNLRWLFNQKKGKMIVHYS